MAWKPGRYGRVQKQVLNDEPVATEDMDVAAKVVRRLTMIKPRQSNTSAVSGCLISVAGLFVVPGWDKLLCLVVFALSIRLAYGYNDSYRQASEWADKYMPDESDD